MSEYDFVSALLAKTAYNKADRAETRVNQIFIRRAGEKKDPVVGKALLGVNQLILRVARPNFPDLNWTDDTMFHETAIFPYDISYNSEGSEVFSTDISVADSGHDQRLAHWDEPLMEYNVAYGVRTLEQLHALKRLFRVVRGQKDGFRFRDHMDYTSSFAVGEEARSPDAISHSDQIIGTGDGVTDTFQLIKTYEFEGEEVRRTIRKPEEGSVLLAVDGLPFAPGTYTVDHSTGLVTFGERASDSVSAATMTRLSTTSRRIQWTGEQALEGLLVGDWVHISGFALTANRIPETEPWQITSIRNDLKRIDFVVPTGSDTALGVNETTPSATVTIAVIPAPRPGAVVTAGFRFHIPVRFQTDRLPIRLEHYGVGSATEVKLIEIREG